MILATKKQKEVAEVAVYTKQQLLSAKKYRRRMDVLNVQLKDNQKYTIEQVDNLIKKFEQVKG